MVSRLYKIFTDQTNDSGCRTCRKRKVKCDERRPSCRRCQQSKRECEGYAVEHRFIDENTRTERHAQKKSLHRNPWPKPPSRQDPLILPLYKSSLGSELGLEGFAYNIYVSFLLSNLFLGMPASTNWPNYTNDSASSSVMLCTKALATLYFGRFHHRKDITMHGQDLYGQALISLNQDLQDRKSGLSLSVLTSAVVLELYEASHLQSYARIVPF